MYCDIIHIVIQYLEPLCLGNFFVKYDLNYEMKFVYDSKNAIIEGEELNVVFAIFPNMVLIGMTIDTFNCCDNSEYNYNLNRFVNLSHCGLYKLGLTIKSKLFKNEFKHICKITNIKKLQLYNCYAFNDILLLCRELKHLVIGKNYVDSPILLSISNCTKLRKLVIYDNIFMDDDEIHMLSKLTELTHLKLFVNMMSNFPLNCANLRTLKIKNMTNNTLNIVKGCYNLEHLVIINCTNLTDVSALKECPKLKSVTVRGFALDDNVWRDLRRIKIKDKNIKNKEIKDKKINKKIKNRKIKYKKRK